MAFAGITDDQLWQFETDGYLLLPDLFAADEINLLLKTARDDKSLETSALERRDGEGGITKLKIWNEAGDDLYGRFVRCRRIVDTMERLLGGEVYFYHSKLMLKEPFTGGAWAWHQDYGYWYNNGCLFPYMASCLIALDRATRENGCLQVLKGSHRAGRIDHGKVGDQTGANIERVEHFKHICPLFYCEMEPGSAIFFHCNLLHRSDQNQSASPRWSYIACYNAARNNPVKEHHHPRLPAAGKSR